LTPVAVPAKAWIFPERESSDTINALAESLGIDRHLAQLLVQRGIRTFDESKAFFRPHWNDLGDPALMKGMDKAVELWPNALITAKEFCFTVITMWMAPLPWLWFMAI